MISAMTAEAFIRIWRALPGDMQKILSQGVFFDEKRRYDP
jgi:hypothetical protein